MFVAEFCKLLDYLLSRVFVQLDVKGREALEPYHIEQVKYRVRTCTFSCWYAGM